MRKAPLVLCFLLALIIPSAAQNQCYFCNSQSSVRKVTYGTNKYDVCAECRAKPQRCDLCGRQGQPELLQDGRMICAACKKSRILTQEQLESLYVDVKNFLKSDSAGILLKTFPPVRLADKDEIQTKFTASGRSMEVSGFYSPYNPEEILILSGQTKESSAATAVHEYTHAWQSRNCPSQDRALTEGFASWVEYRYLKSRGHNHEAQQLTRKDNPDYGASLLKLLEMEKKIGVAGVVKFAKTESKLP